MLRHDGFGDVPVTGQEHACVLANSGKKILSLGGLLACTMSRSQAFGVLFETLDTEEFGADRFFQRGRTGGGGRGDLQL
jgi:hypothetical protein